MTVKTKITFLGTSDAIPSSKRNHTSVLLTYDGENILVDCGEGTQRQLRKARINPCKITRLLITHWHGDHVLGIPGLLQTLSLSGYNKTLYIYGPRGTKKFIKAIMDAFVFVGKYPIEIQEVDSEKFFENEHFYLEASAMTHGTPCNAYSFVKKEQLKIDKDKLKKYKIPQSPILKNIKEGKDIEYEGKKYSPKQLTSLDEGHKVTFIWDSNKNSSMVDFAKDSDVLVMEASFDSSLEKRAKEYHHMTAKQDAEIAKKANASKLYLTHISQRYEQNPELILKEAKDIFKNTFIAKDLDKIEI